VLIGIHPLLSGELLHALDDMGHGDELVIADANFPGRRLAAGRVLRLPVGAVDAVRAVLTVFPLDPEERVVLMAAPDGEPEVQREILAALPAPAASGVDRITRHDFYDAARSSALILQTAEFRPYANVMLAKAGINQVGA
jgi:L-fucose mutarotase